MPTVSPIDSGCNGSILIVDDDKFILDVLSRGFKLFGMTVFTAENGIEGWTLVNKERIDTLLTDIRMPGDIDGASMVSLVRKKLPGMTIAVMTGGDAQAGNSLLEDRAVDHLFIKPFSLSYVCKALMAEARAA